MEHGNAKSPEGRERLLVQLSDIPWMLVAGLLGLACEVVVRSSGRLISPGWVTVLEIVVLNGVGYGYIAFRWGRSPNARLVGGLLGGAWGWFAASLALETWVLGAGPMAGVALRAIFGALLPALTDRLVDPLLLRGPLGKLASHNPRYTRLQPGSFRPAGWPPPGQPRAPREPGS